MSVTATVTPPVRGSEKALVATHLVLGAAATATLTGFAAGLAWTVVRLPALPVGAVLALVVLALAVDDAHRRGRAPAPLAVRRQVPAAWSALFAPPMVALLYGSRLGAGPLTLLPSWTWWAAAVAAAALGPGGSALAGAAFGLSRGLATIAAAEVVRRDSVSRMARLVGAETTAQRLLVGFTAGACLAAAL